MPVKALCFRFVTTMSSAEPTRRDFLYIATGAVARRLPGALAEESGAVESFSPELKGGLEYPHYTRPSEFRGWRVPDVLLSGDHRRIDEWRKEQSRLRTGP